METPVTEPEVIESPIADAPEDGTPIEPQPTAEPVAEAATPEQVAAAYAADYKFKFDGQDKELDEWLRPVIKDPDTEQKLKDIMQRAMAHDKYKPKLPEYEKVVGTVNHLAALKSKGEHERVLSDLGYDDETLFEVVRQKLERLKWAPEQKQAFDEKQQLAIEKEQLARENESYRSEATKGFVQQTDFELNNELGKADYRQLIDAFDKSNGSGSFREMVVQRGAQLVDSLGRHVAPSELLQTIVRDYKPFMNMVQAQASNVTAAAKPKVIPSVGSGTASPGKKAVTSISDLKKLRDKMLEDEE